MALTKQVITLDFGYGGLDQKSDEKRVLPVRFTELTDVRFNKIGRVDRRPGHAAVGTLSVTVGAFLNTGRQLLAVRGPENQTPYVYRLMTDGTATLPASGVSPVQRMHLAEMRSESMGAIRQFVPNAAVCSRADGASYYAAAYLGQDSSGTNGILIELRDRTNNELYRSISTIATNAAIAPAIVANPLSGDSFVLAYANSSFSVVYAVFSATTDPTTIAALATETVGTRQSVALLATVDPSATNGAALWVAVTKGASGVKLTSTNFPTTGGVGASIGTTTIAVVGGSADRVALSTLNDPTKAGNVARLSWLETTTGIRSGVYSRTCSAVLAPNVMVSDTTVANMFDIAGAETSSTATSWLAVSSTLVAGTPFRTQVFQINASNTPSIVSTVMHQTLASQMRCAPGTDTAMFLTWAIGMDPTQQCIMAMSAATSVATGDQCLAVSGRLFYGTGYIQQNSYMQLPAMSFTGGEFVSTACALQRTGYSQDPASDLANFNAIKMRAGGVGWCSAAYKNNLAMGGGFGAIANGDIGFLPMGPLQAPIIQTSTISATTGGSLSVGSYAVTFTYEVVDSSGRVMRSPPAIPATVTLSGTQTKITCNVISYCIPDNFLTSGCKVRLIPYRTLVNESQVYYRGTAVSVTGWPSASVTNQATLFTVADATLATQQPLYTTGGVFADYVPSAPRAMASNGRRLLCVEADNPNFVLESKPIKDGYGIGFMQGVGRSVEPSGDRIYALASYLDKWFAFKAGAIFVAQGDGADVTGQNDTLSEFQPMSDGLGTTQPRSVVSTSEGVVFNSQKGFFIIGGDMQATYIGDAVEDYTSPVIDSAYDDVNDCVYFILADGTCLVLTMFVTAKGVDPRWSVDTIAAASSIAALNGVRYFAPKSISGLTSSIYKETPGTYVDANVSSTAVPEMAATTAWTAMGQIQGFGRIWKALCLGTFPAAQASTTVTVQIAYDYSSTWAETHTIASTAFQQNGNNCQFEIRPARQKCESIRFRITQSGPATFGGGAAGLSLNQIQLVVGVKANDNKTPATSRMTKG